MNNFNISKFNSLVQDFKKIVKQNLKLLKENEDLLFKRDIDEVQIKRLQKENEHLKRLLLNEIKNKQIRTSEVPTCNSFKERETTINIYC